MNNPFKNNSLASGLLGYILGAMTVIGGSYIAGYSGFELQQTGVNSGLITNPDTHYSIPEQDNDIREYPPYRGLSENPEGDVIITKTGDCYHSIYGCSSLKYTRRKVAREDAKSVGFTACSKCNP